MKKILLFGAGKSATCLITYLAAVSALKNWQLVVADGNLELAKSKIKDASHAVAVEADVQDEMQRKELVQQAAVVISMLPPTLHFLVAKDCVDYGKHLLTASYVDEETRELRSRIEEKGLLFLCESGLDPGIDHMSAMQLIHRIQANGGKINSFYSHCGGLVAPESDDNPWHYKVSWNPRNIVLAGKAGATYKLNNAVQHLSYDTLFDSERIVKVPGHGYYAWYPNRDSLAYIGLYKLEETATFIRTTLRHPDFCLGWKKIVELELTDEKILYDTGAMTYKSFFDLHLKKHGFKEAASGREKELLAYLGLYSNDIIHKGTATAADIIQAAIEAKLILQPSDRDMIIMLHEINYTLDGEAKKIKSSLVVKGENNLVTAMAKTVGLPLGIAARLILEEKIKLSGLHIPILPEIYEPVLSELANEGIRFQEEEC